MTARGSPIQYAKNANWTHSYRHQHACTAASTQLSVITSAIAAPNLKRSFDFFNILFVTEVHVEYRMTALVRFRRHHVSAIPFLQRWRIGGYKRARHRRFQCSSRIALKSLFGEFVEIQHALNSFLIFQNASYRDQMIRVKWNYNKVVDNLADFQTVENWRHIRCSTNRNSRYVCRILNVALTCRWSRNCRLESHGKRVWWCRLTHRCIAERLWATCFMWAVPQGMCAWVKGLTFSFSIRLPM